MRTLSAHNHFSRGSESDADDEGEIIRRAIDEVKLHRPSAYSDGSRSRDASVEASENDDEFDDDDDDASIGGREFGLKTPPSQPIPLNEDHTTPPSQTTALKTDTNLGRYEALFMSLETPRSQPAGSPIVTSEPLPSAFALLRSLNANTNEPSSLDSTSKTTPTATGLGPAPVLDIDGWRATKDDKPETWCCKPLFYLGCHSTC